MKCAVHFRAIDQISAHTHSGDVGGDHTQQARASVQAHGRIPDASIDQLQEILVAGAGTGLQFLQLAQDPVNIQSMKICIGKVFKSHRSTSFISIFVHIGCF